MIKNFQDVPISRIRSYANRDTDVKAIKKLKNPVSLDQIKENNKLKNIALVKQSRLSVMPLKKTEWDIIIKMSN